MRALTTPQALCRLAVVVAALAVAPASAAARGPAEPDTVERRSEVYVWSGSGVVPVQRGEAAADRQVWVFSSGDRSAEVELLGPRRGSIGVELVELTEELREHLGAPPGVGVLISRVATEGPAALAGVRVGDIVVAVDGARIDSRWSLRRSVAGVEEGATVELALLRDGRRLETTVAVEVLAPRVIDIGSFMASDDSGRAVFVRPDVDWQGLADAWGWEMRTGESGDSVDLHLEPRLDEAFERAVEALEDPELRARIERELQSRAELERRLAEMEERLKELERQLGDEGGD